MATGVLPIMLGRATRAIPLLPSHKKAYRATLKFGCVSTTLDVWGEVTETGKPYPTPEEVTAALPAFRGNVLQVPPMTSALKKDGVRLYDLARQGIEIEREARPITIHRLDLVEYVAESGTLTFDCACSAGTYIRTLCDDLGCALGCGAVMTALCRTAAAGYTLDDSYTIDEWRSFAENGTLETHIHPVDSAFTTYTAVTVTAPQATRFQNGGALALDRLGEQTVSGPTRVYAPNGEFLGLGTPENGELHILRLLGGITNG